MWPGQRCLLQTLVSFFMCLSTFNFLLPNLLYIKDHIDVRDQHYTGYLVFFCFRCEFFNILAVVFDQTLTWRLQRRRFTLCDRDSPKNQRVFASCTITATLSSFTSHFYFWVVPVRCSGTLLKPITDCHGSCLFHPTPSFCQCCKIWFSNFSSISCTKGRPTMLCIELLSQQSSPVKTSFLPGRFSQLAQALGHLCNSKDSAHCLILLWTLLNCCWLPHSSRSFTCLLNPLFLNHISK